MEEITHSDSPTAILEQPTKQPNPFILALLLTGILYFGVRPTQPNQTVSVASPVQASIKIAEPVADAVLKDVSQRSGLPASRLQIIQAKPLTWLDHCLGLEDSGIGCKESPVPGWYVTVTNGSQRWFYRTNASGSLVKLDDNSSPQKKSRGFAIALRLLK